MKGDILRSKILSEKIIPNMNEQYRKQFPIPEGHRSLGIFTADCDDVCYIGMDEASKSTDIEIVHATALYAGAANASFKLSGEFYGAFSAPNPEISSVLLRSFIRSLRTTPILSAAMKTTRLHIFPM